MNLLLLLPLFLQEVFTHRAVVSGLHFQRLTHMDNVKPEGTPGAIYQSRSKLECASFCARDRASCAAVMYHGGQCSIYRSLPSPSNVSLPGARGFQKQVPHEYLGCYDRYKEIKWAKSFATELTPEFCMMNCYGNGYSYILMDKGRWCYCGDDPPDVIYKKADNECNSPCTGDSTKMCGGPGFLSVYKTD